MKQIITILLIFSFFNGRTQAMYPYVFSKTNGTYQNLIGSTSLTNNSLWFDTIMSVPIGFPFKWALTNRTLDSIQVLSDGVIFASNDMQPGNWLSRFISPMICYMSDKGYNTQTLPQSNISYLTTGTSPYRICKIEFRNCGAFLDMTGQDSLNFQVWLYEGTNAIEFHYGPCYVNDAITTFYGDPGPWINLIYNVTYDQQNDEFYYNQCTYVRGDNITASTVTPTTPINVDFPPSDFPFVGLPANGQIFRWGTINSPNISSEINTFNPTQVYPSPFNNILYIEHQSNIKFIQLSDLNGRVLIQENVRGNKAELNTKSLSNGVYFLTITDAKGNQKTMKVVK